MSASSADSEKDSLIAVSTPNYESLNSSNTSTTSQYRVYKQRWYILSVVVVLNLSNAMIWITFSPIADTTVPYYQITPFQLNLLVLVFAIASVPFGFVASWLLDTLGLRLSLIIAGWLNGIGSLLRNISTMGFVSSEHRFTWCLTGQILAACSQPFIMFAPTKLAAVWFAGDQRATANMMASMANPLGIMVASILAPSVVNSQKDIPTLLWIITGPSVLVMFMATFGVCSSTPPTPPSSSAEQTSEPFFQGLKKICFNKNYLVLNFVFGTGLAMFTAFTSFYDQMLCPRGYSDNFAGLCGAVMIAVGALGSVFAGLYVDRSKKFEEVVKVCMGIGAIFVIAFSQVARLRNQQVLVGITSALFGGFGFAIYPICLELAVEVTYPIAEATSTGLMVISGQIQSIIYMLLMQVITQPLSSEEAALPSGCSTTLAKANDFTPMDWTVPLLFGAGVFSFAYVILILFFKAEYRRMNEEQRIAAEKILHIDHEISLPTKYAL